MTSRPYSSPARKAAAARTRARLLEAATGLLRAEPNPAAFSLEAVAKAAGVTRLTVYNQFGSRRGLMEAAFDEVARTGGLWRIPEAMADPDPRAGLDRLVGIFCDFWASDPALAALQAAGASDPEFGQAVTERNERRRHGFTVLVERLRAAGLVRDDAARYLVDLLFALTSEPMFRMLSVGGRDAAGVRQALLAASAALVRDAKASLEKSAK